MKNNKDVLKTSKKYSMISNIFAIFKVLAYGIAVFAGIATKNLWTAVGLIAGGFAVGSVGEVKFAEKAKTAEMHEKFMEYCGNTYTKNENSQSDTENNI